MRLWSFVTLIIVLLISFASSAQTDGAAGGGLGGKLFGMAHFANNWVDRGASQTTNQFVVQAQIGYQWTQFQLSLLGSSLNHPTTGDSLFLKPNLSYRFIFSQNSDLTILYALPRSMSSGDFNGTELVFNLRFFDYEIGYSRYDDWENAGTSTRYSLASTWPLAYEINYRLEGAYSMVQAQNYVNYFDILNKISKEYADIEYSLALSYNSAGSKFSSSRGGLLFIFGLTAKF